MPTDFNKYLKDYEDRKLFNDDLIKKIQCIDDDFGTKTAENVRNCHNMFWSEIWKNKYNSSNNQIKTQNFPYYQPGNRLLTDYSCKMRLVLMKTRRLLKY